MKTQKLCRVVLIAGSLAPLGGFSLVAPTAADEYRDAESANPAAYVDLSSLPPDVLGCNVCRTRLGLAPIAGGGPITEVGPIAQVGVAASDALIELPPSATDNSGNLREAHGTNGGEQVSPREAADAGADHPQHDQIDGAGAASDGQSQERQVQMLRRLVQEVSRIDRESRRTTEELRGNVASLRKQLELSRQAIADLEARLSAVLPATGNETVEVPNADRPAAADDEAAGDDSVEIPAAPETKETPDKPATPDAPAAPPPQQASQKRDI